RADILRLYDVVQRNAHMDPADALDVLDAFERLLPREQRLAERRALLLAELGEAERAWHVLRALDPELLGDDARLLLFRLHAARDGGAGLAAHVLSLDLLSESRFQHFVEALDELPPQTLAGLVPDLVRTLPAEQLRDVIERAGRRLESPDALAETALNLYLATDDAAWAYAFLDERRHALRLADRAVIEALLELAAAGGRADGDDNLADEAARVIGNLIELDRVEEARATLTRAREAYARVPRAPARRARATVPPGRGPADPQAPARGRGRSARRALARGIAHRRPVGGERGGGACGRRVDGRCAERVWRADRRESAGRGRTPRSGEPGSIRPCGDGPPRPGRCWCRRERRGGAPRLARGRRRGRAARLGAVRTARGVAQGRRGAPERSAARPV